MRLFQHCAQCGNNIRYDDHLNDWVHVFDGRQHPAIPFVGSVEAELDDLTRLELELGQIVE